MPDGTGTMHPFADIARAGAAADVPADWLAALRRDAAACYAATGLPGRRDEYWRYTNLNALAAADFAQGDAPVAGNLAVPAEGAAVLSGAHRLVFVDGRLEPVLSTLDGFPEGVETGALADLMARAPERIEPWLGRIAQTAGMPMAVLNTACFGDGAVLLIGDGIVLDAPIEIVSLGTDGAIFQPRNLVVLGDGASATLIESHAGVSAEACYFVNIVSEIALGEGARLAHYKLQDEADGAFHLAFCEARLARGAAYESFVLQTGAQLGRSEVRARFDGRASDCRFAGVYLVRDGQLLDNTTLADHAAPDCRSRQMFKGVLDGASRGVFQGKIKVRREAQRTDGHQLSRALLLSPRAEVDTRPELEIYADDVKCSHGATAGDLDEDALFYLLSRGIEPATARRMLAGAFIGEALETIGHPEVAAAFSAHVDGWLDRHIGAAPETEEAAA